MRKAQQLHNSAMRATDQALEAQRRGDSDSCLTLFKDAFKLEAEAARLTREQPSKSILFRSAANLAIEAGDLDMAEQLACLGLVARPPDDIADELRHALDRANFSRHLRLDGITLSAASVQLAIAGPAIGVGDAPEPEIMARVDAYRRLVRRSASRKRGIPYTDSPSNEASAEDYQLYMSTPRAASFAVTLRVGAREMQNHFEFDANATEVVADVFQNLGHFEADRQEDLKQSIPDADYRRNFIALARKLAPDGSRVTTVGFTRTSSAGNEELALRQPRSLHQMPREKKADSSTVTLRGRLSFADKPDGKKAGQIKLRTEQGEFKIAVPKGILSDIVRPHFDEMVAIRARRRTPHTFEFIEFIDR